LSCCALAGVYHKLTANAVKSSLADRNAASAPADSATLGPDLFAGLPFIRKEEVALDIRPPILTGREVDATAVKKLKVEILERLIGVCRDKKQPVAGGLAELSQPGD
jgi:hypothetical protein